MRTQDRVPPKQRGYRDLSAVGKSSPGPIRYRPKRRRRRVSLLPWLIAILAVEIVTVALIDPRFDLERIQVRGVAVLTPTQVERLSGLQRGVNLFRVDCHAARKRLLEVPAIADVTLQRRLPNRVIIHVRERVPLACVQAKNALFTIDAEGVAFRKDTSPPKEIPLVSGFQGEPLYLGQMVDEPKARALQALVEAAATYSRPIRRVYIDQSANLCFNNEDSGYEVRLGPAVQLAEKLALLAALERSMPELRSSCEYIDLSCLEAPAWKPVKVATVPNHAQGDLRATGLKEGSPNGRGGVGQD